MHKLAELVLRGRIYALVIAVIIGYIPLVSWGAAVVVAIVALRKGLNEAIWPLAGASIPAAYAWMLGDSSFAGVLLVSLSGALVLANTQRLGWALLTVCAVAFAVLFGLEALVPQQLDRLVENYQVVLQQLDVSLQQAVDMRLFALQGLAWSMCWIAAITLLVARWLQAKLFNPGGFQREFHSLRLTPVASGCLVLAMAVVQGFESVEPFIPILVMPLVLAGLGLLHGVAYIKKWGVFPLVAAYASLFPPFVVIGLPLMMMVAIGDSFINVRERLALK